MKNSIGKIKQIENIQRRATRIPSLKGLSDEDRSLELDLPTLEKRRNRGDLIELFKIMKNRINLNWHYPPRPMNSDRESRLYNLRVERQLTSSRIRYDFLPNRIAHQWNSLSQTTVDIVDVNKFKNAIDPIFYKNLTLF